MSKSYILAYKRLFSAMIVSTTSSKNATKLARLLVLSLVFLSRLSIFTIEGAKIPNPSSFDK